MVESSDHQGRGRVQGGRVSSSAVRPHATRTEDRVPSDRDVAAPEAEDGRCREDLVSEVVRLREELAALRDHETALERIATRYRMMVENANDAIVVAQDDVVRFVNPKAASLSGYSEEELTSRPFVEFIHPDDREVVAMQHQIGMRSPAGTGLIYCFRIITKAGATLWVQINPVSILWEGRPATLNLLSDITERKQAQRTIMHLAYHDSLTGLANRMLFHDRLSLALTQAGRKGSRLAVMLVDLDRFKEINDTHGHAAGDELLCQVGARLRGTLRQGDSVARMGGDEFMLLLPELAHVGDVTVVADKVLDVIRHPFELRGATARISASIGTAVFPDDAEDEEGLLHAVDHAMYRAKGRGGDRLCCAGRAS